MSDENLKTFVVTMVLGMFTVVPECAPASPAEQVPLVGTAGTLLRMPWPPTGGRHPGHRRHRDQLVAL